MSGKTQQVEKGNDCRTYDGLSRVPVVFSHILGAVVGNNVNLTSC
jgi:hypothetical protein